MDFFDSPLFRGETNPPAAGENPAAAIDFEAELNPEQFAAVSAPPGPALVLAGAGSGKTRTLTYRVAWLLKEGVRPSEILLLTFTNKAAREMLGRVEELTGVPTDHFWGGTFHHIGQRLLRRFGRAIGIEPSFTILDQGDAESLLGEAIRETDPSFLKSKENPKPRVIGDWISYARNTRRPIGEVVKERAPFSEDIIPSVSRFAFAYETRKRAQGVTDFDDLLELWLKLLEESRETATWCATRFAHLLVDEYQDTNALQSSIIEQMAPHHRIMAVGDDAQCIYTWRGADYDNIQTFPERHPDTAVFKIETNYRSTPNILNFANGILSGRPGGTGFDKELRAVREIAVNPALITVTDTVAQAEFLVRRIHELIDEGFRLADIAVLYRAHYQAMDAQLELSRKGIPYHITSGIRFFEQAHVKDLAAQLRFLSNPKDSSAFLRFAGLLPKVGPRTAEKLHLHLLATARKKDLRVIEILADPATVAKVPKTAIEDWGSLAASLIDADRALLEEASPDRVVQLVVDGWYSDWLKRNHDNWQSRSDDLDSLVGFAQRFDTLSDLLTQLSLSASETADRSVDMREDALRMTTVHQAKGLEFPVVFVLGAADGLFPLQRAIEYGDVEEERRLFYVAVTRAKDHLYLLYPRVTAQGGPPRLLSPSRFLGTVPEHQYQKVKYTSHRAW